MGNFSFLKVNLDGPNPSQWRISNMHIYLKIKPTALVAKYVINPYFGLNYL